MLCSIMMETLGDKEAMSFLQHWIVVGLALFAIIALWGLPYLPTLYSDSGHYIALAEGRTEEVPKPYAGRFLHPASAGALSRTFGIPLFDAFSIIAVTSLLIFALVASAILAQHTGSALWILPVAVNPLLVHLFISAYLPDLFHMAMLALFFMFLSQELFVAAIVLFVPLCLIRETSMVLGMVLVVAFLWQRRLLLGLATLGTIALGSVLVGAVTPATTTKKINSCSPG